MNDLQRDARAGRRHAALAAVLLAAAPVFTTARAAQVEVDHLPATVLLEAEAAGRLQLGVHAIEPLVQPALGGHRLVNQMPHDATVIFGAGGRATFSYHDLFLRHYRDRQQTLISSDDELLENLNDLPPGAQRPKILLDAWTLDAPDLYLDGRADQLYWTGTLVWKFDPGLPITGLSLANPQGHAATKVGDDDWQERGQPVIVSVSADESSWYELWRSSGEGGESIVTGSLPPALAGVTTLYLRFQGLENALYELYVTLDVDGSSVLPALDLEAGTNTVSLSSSYGGGAAVLFWTNEDVRLLAKAPSPPATVDVTVSADLVHVAFPSGGWLDLCRSTSGGVTGPCRLEQGGTSLLQPPLGGLEEAAVVFVDGDPIPGYADWKAEVDAYLAHGTWRTSGTRTLRTVPLGGTTLLGTEIGSDGVVRVRTRLDDGASTGTLTWEIRPAADHLADRHWRGVAWRVRLEGLETASAVLVTEPVVLPVGSWWIEQVFRAFTDDALDLASPYNLPPSKLGASSQSFRFAAGPEGAEAALFEVPVCAPFIVRDERARRLIRTRLPLGTGSDRVTPWRSWLVDPVPVSDAWAARDLWARVRDEVATRMAREQGISISRPRPTLVWNQPSGEYYSYWIAHHTPPDGVFWLDWARESLLPRAAAWGVDTLYIQPPWDSDSEHVEGGSGNAPRDLVFSPAIGGEAAMRSFVARAHELGLRIVLWYPSTFSLRATIFEDHPGWVAFTAGGTPENGGWADVAGADLRSGYLNHVLARLKAIQSSVHPDGYWLDSWVSLTLLTDYRYRQPAPQLAGAEELMRTMWQNGVRQVITEGLGPLAGADAYGDYEVWSGPPVPAPGPLLELEQIRGREYMLYRLGANLLPDSETYFRALAAGGVVTLSTLDNLDYLEPEDTARILAANRAFRVVGDLLTRRRLVVRDDTWVGVAWENQAGRVLALFAFTAFDFPVVDGTRVEEVSGETVSPVEVTGGSLHAAAWKVYRLTPPPPSPRRPRAAARP